MRILLLTFILASTSIFAQKGYRIDFKIKGLKDTTAYLGYYFQEKPYARDTARVNFKGEISFEGEATLSHGIYFLLVDQTRLFEFVVGPVQRFSLETNTEDYITNMVVKGDNDNRIFFENMIQVTTKQKEVQPLVVILQDSSVTAEKKNEVRKNYTDITKKIMDFQEEIITKYPTSATARILNMNRPIVIPDPPKKPNGNIDSTFQLKYYRQHYFDNFPLGDEITLRVHKVQYWNKVQEYLDKLYVQDPDSISNALYKLIDVAKANKDTYRHLVWNAMGYYQSPKIMGMDEVYINLADKYVATGEMDYWLDKKTVQNVKDEVNKMRRALIGSTGENLIMLDDKLQPRSLYDLKNKYTVLFFFKPTCGTCREEAPHLVNFYNDVKKQFDLEVFAVSTDTSMNEMKKFIKDFNTTWITVNGPRFYTKSHFSKLYYAESTPTIYILDDKKKVIARKLDVSQMKGFLENYDRMRSKRVIN
jgi:thiol-disulfide isomerase/thioredoxin